MGSPAPPEIGGDQAKTNSRLEAAKRERELLQAEIEQAQRRLGQIPSDERPPEPKIRLLVLTSSSSR